MKCSARHGKRKGIDAQKCSSEKKINEYDLAMKTNDNGIIKLKEEIVSLITDEEGAVKDSNLKTGYCRCQLLMTNLARRLHRKATKRTRIIRTLKKEKNGVFNHRNHRNGRRRVQAPQIKFRMMIQNQTTSSNQESRSYKHFWELKRFRYWVSERTPGKAGKRSWKTQTLRWASCPILFFKVYFVRI